MTILGHVGRRDLPTSKAFTNANPRVTAGRGRSMIFNDLVSGIRR
jgi:hypothetical protein